MLPTSLPTSSQLRGLATLLALALVAALATSTSPAAAASVGLPGPPVPGSFVPGVVVVQSAPSAERAAALAVAEVSDELGVTATDDGLGAGDDGQLRVLEVPPGSEDELIAALTGDPAIAFVQRDRYVSLTGGSWTATPNDPYLHHASQYRHTLVPETWPAAARNGLVVAVLDTGVTSNAEVAAARVLAGHDFVNDDADPADDHNHGTSVAGILVGTHNNAYASAGVCPSCTILPVKVLGSDGRGTMSDTAVGIRYAADQGADIINLSLGYASETVPVDKVTTDAIAYARAKGALLIAAAGNQGDEVPSYPAAYDGVLSVSGIGADGLQHPNATHGQWVDVAAPFVNVTVDKDGRAIPFGGTSGAAPHASGIAALLWGANPGLSGDEIAATLAGTSVPMATIKHGYLSAPAALAARPDSALSVTISGPAADSVVGGDVAVTVAATPSEGLARIDLLVDRAAVASTSKAAATLIWDTTTVADGPVRLTAKAYNTTGSRATSTVVTLTVDNAGSATEPQPEPEPVPAGPRIIPLADGPLRSAGGNRYDTAAALTSSTWEGDVARVYVATGSNFPDALAAGAAAAHHGAPVVLTDARALPSASAAELARLSPDEIVVVGGPSAISAEVLAELDAYGTVRRIFGADRFATARQVALDGFDGPVPVAYIAAGGNFPDALAGGPVAGARGGPLLLTAHRALPGSTAEALRALEPAHIVVLGSRGVVTDEVLAQLAELTDGTVTRQAGGTRFDTAVAVSKATFPDRVDVVFLATGGNFPDALAGGSAAAVRRGPLLLTASAELPESVRAEIARLRPRTIVVLGGESAVSAETLEQAYTATGR